MYDRLAQIALDVMRGASVQADDQALAATLQARSMLRDIASGKLVVGAPLKDSESPSEAPQA